MEIHGRVERSNANDQEEDVNEVRLSRLEMALTRLGVLRHVSGAIYSARRAVRKSLSVVLSSRGVSVNLSALKVGESFVTRGRLKITGKVRSKSPCATTVEFEPIVKEFEVDGETVRIPQKQRSTWCNETEVERV